MTGKLVIAMQSEAATNVLKKSLLQANMSRKIAGHVENEQAI
jgi:hypothetical protein